MEVIQARNVNYAYRMGASLLGHKGILRETRAGPALVMPVPVTTMYERPTERVLFDAVRDANPFFHFFESLWILAGRNDVDWLRRFNSNIANFSDDGKVFYGAYGHRFRFHFGEDQIKGLIDKLSKDKNSRQAVLGIWDPENDLTESSKDIPCNLSVKFEVVDNALNMIVYNRSNDMIWGAYGANVVHFSYLQEFVAGWLGVDVGWYCQVSGNFHAYLDTWRKSHLDSTYKETAVFDSYESGQVKPYPQLMQDPVSWHEDLVRFVNEIGSGADVSTFNEPFFADVAVPLYDSWEFWQDREMDSAINAARECHASDWSLAAVEWLQRRRK
jgi:hypothetical protein